MWYELGEIAQVGSGYPFRGKVENNPDGGLVVLQQKDISDLAAMGSWQLTGVVPESAAHVEVADTYRKHLLNADDVLLQVRGGQFRSVVFSGDYPAIAAQGVAVLRPKPELLPAFLCWFINHPKSTERLRSMAGGTHIPFISKKTLATYKVPVPSLETQQRVMDADDIRRQHRAASLRLIELNDELVDALTWQATIQD